MKRLNGLCGFDLPKTQQMPPATARHRGLMIAATVLFSIGISHAIAPCNTPSEWVNNTTYNNLSTTRTFGGGLCVTSATGAVSNIVDSDTSNSTSFNLTGLGCNVTYSVKDADLADTHPAGYYAGFKISTASLLTGGVAANVRIETYNNGSLAEAKDVISSGIGINTSLLDASGLATVGFVTTQPFNEIRLKYTTLLGTLFSGTVYHPVIERYCSGPALNCNTETPITRTSYPVSAPSNLNGITGLVCAGCSVNHIDYLLNANTSDYADIVMTAGVGSTAAVAVKDQLTVYPAGTLAGFNIERPSLADVDLLSGLRLKTYLNGSLQETSNNGSLLSVSSALLTGTARQQVSFLTTQPFDTVQLEIDGLASVASTTRIYNAIFERFCNGPALSCNIQTPILPTDYPVIINGIHTGLNNGVCVGCGVLNAANLLTTSTSDYANIVLSAGVLASGSIAVKDVLTNYPAGTFAGFLIENPNLIGVDLLSGLTLRTYKDGVLQETASGSNGNLLSVDASLLTGSSGPRQLGLITTLPFDEVQLEVTNLLGVLNNTRIYYAMFQKQCAGPSPNCGINTYLTAPSYPVWIDQGHSNIEGLVCALCAVNNTQNVIDNDSNNYSEIILAVGVLASGSISVHDVLTTYSAGTFAGFDIYNSALVDVDLLSGASITTYLHGVEQESKQGSLLSLELLTAARQTIGFQTTKPFDEIRLTLKNLATVNIGSTKVYGALIRPAEVGSENPSGGGTGICPALRDYGDAPFSYGTAAHTVTNGIYLGSTAPDRESYSLNTSNGFADNTGDDVTGIADEGDLIFSPLYTSDSNYSLTIQCTGIGTVAGWIDFDHSGAFTSTERSSALCSGGTATLSWNNISPQAGPTHARLRIAFNASDVQNPIGVASTGEVEDYVFAVSSQTQISGRVFVDNSGSTGLVNLAYNGIQDDLSEQGLANTLIELTNCMGSVIGSTQSNANGDYQFNLLASQLSSPSFCLVQHNLEGYTSVSGSNTYDLATDTITVSNNGSSQYTGNLFGDSRLTLALSGNGQKTIAPNSVAQYTHRLKTDAVLTASINLANTESPNNLGWTSVIYHDLNCNDQIDTDDPVLTNNLPIMLPSSTVCLIEQVHSPAAASNGAQYISTLTATFSATVYNNTELTGSSNEVTNTTLIGTGSLAMFKQVRRVANCNGPITALEAFSKSNNAQNGDFLQYEIRYSNGGTRNLSQIRVRDAVPSNTQFKQMNCGTTPTDANCSVEVQPIAGDQGEMNWLVSGPVKPATEGTVDFCVQVTALNESPLTP